MNDEWLNVAPDPADYAVSGIDIDGVNYPLGGQPPVAVSHGWGDLSFLADPPE